MGLHKINTDWVLFSPFINLTTFKITGNDHLDLLSEIYTDMERLHIRQVENKRNGNKWNFSPLLILAITLTLLPLLWSGKNPQHPLGGWQEATDDESYPCSSSRRSPLTSSPPHRQLPPPFFHLCLPPFLSSIAEHHPSPLIGDRDRQHIGA